MCSFRATRCFAVSTPVSITARVLEVGAIVMPASHAASTSASAAKFWPHMGML
jgi:hypothetical protein